jgi:CheY-like chemotaxis protein
VSSPPLPGTPLSIVIIEDNPADVWLIQEALRHSGLPHETRVIEDGEEACVFLEQCSTGSALPDVMILDLNLPRVDGASILSMMQSEGLGRVPVVILSSSKAPNDIALGANRENVVYIIKPNDLDAFLDVGNRIRDLWSRTKGGEPEKI